MLNAFTPALLIKKLEHSRAQPSDLTSEILHNARWSEVKIMRSRVVDFEILPAGMCQMSQARARDLAILAAHRAAASDSDGS